MICSTRPKPVTLKLQLKGKTWRFVIHKNSAPCDIPSIAPILNGDFTVDIQGLTMHAWLNLVALTLNNWSAKRVQQRKLT